MNATTRWSFFSCEFTESLIVDIQDRKQWSKQKSKDLPLGVLKHHSCVGVSEWLPWFGRKSSSRFNKDRKKVNMRIRIEAESHQALINFNPKVECQLSWALTFGRTCFE